MRAAGHASTCGTARPDQVQLVGRCCINCCSAIALAGGRLQIKRDDDVAIADWNCWLPGFLVGAKVRADLEVTLPVGSLPTPCGLSIRYER